ncbi:hypothetical protein COO60DRAFT_821770 [Scenedesmus sp. NREL 46B-D3]|nr:hypothetical protein COO60DRAFT_821770 [Scenedesmus sp. NREL 46B-D3]
MLHDAQQQGSALAAGAVWQRGRCTAAGAAGHSATVVGSKVYVFGGRKGSKFFNDLLVYDSCSGQWASGPECPVRPRANHTATLVGSKLWIIGTPSTCSCAAHMQLRCTRAGQPPSSCLAATAATQTQRRRGT